MELLGQGLTLRSTHMREIRRVQRSTLRVSENPPPLSESFPRSASTLAAPWWPNLCLSEWQGDALHLFDFNDTIPLPA